MNDSIFSQKSWNLFSLKLFLKKISWMATAYYYVIVRWNWCWDKEHLVRGCSNKIRTFLIHDIVRVKSGSENRSWKKVGHWTLVCMLSGGVFQGSSCAYMYELIFWCSFMICIACISIIECTFMIYIACISIIECLNFETLFFGEEGFLELTIRGDKEG